MAKRDIRCEACGTLNRVPRYSFRRVPNCGKCGATLPEWWATRALRKLYVFRFPITLVAFAGVLVWALWLTFGGNILAVKKTSAPPRPVPQQIACTPTEPITIHGIYRVYDTRDQPRLTQWTISAGGGSNYFVKLFDATNGAPKVSYFAYGGSMLTTDAPVGVFIVKYASGEVWCGENDLFGASTVTRKGKRPAILDEDHTYTLFLTPQPHGNFPTESIPRSEF